MDHTGSSHMGGIEDKYKEISKHGADRYNPLRLLPADRPP